MIMSRRLLGFLVFCAAAAAAAAVMYVRGVPPGVERLFLWRPAVTMVLPTRGPAVQAVYATGSVEPVYWAKVAPTTVGRIVEIKARDGDEVKRGDVLARLDDREEKARLTELEARERFLKKDLERYAALAQRDVVSRKAFDQTASDHAQALAAAAAARQRLADLTLLSPLDGRILRQDGEVGEVVSKDEVLFWVGQSHPLRIVAEVDEEDIPLVRVGQKVLIKADAFPKQVFEGTVAEITPKGDPIAKNYRIRIGLPPDLPLLIGMTTEVNIVAREKENALLIPFSAVKNGTVWVVEDGRARARKVETGIAGDMLLEVTSGLGDGEAVVDNPPATLREGARVRVTATRVAEEP
ncbi:MAG: efflux RND transporter periplasmic adaptor subunit [Alphaproteobacteria bacterium]